MDAHYNYSSYTDTAQWDSWAESLPLMTKVPATDVYDLEGNPVSLNQLLCRAQLTVVEFLSGSIYQNLGYRYLEVPTAGTFDGRVQYLTVYTREGIPDDDWPTHLTLEQKISQATRFAARLEVKGSLFVDDLSGALHRLAGSMPNSLWVFDESVALFKAKWRAAGELRRWLTQYFRMELAAQHNPGSHQIYNRVESVLPQLRSRDEFDTMLQISE